MRVPRDVSTEPPSASPKPATSFSRVDLPVPLRPTRPTRVPVGIEAEALSRMTLPPSRTVMVFKVSMARA